MVINDEINTRINLTIPKELKQQLEAEAKEQGRSLNNYILYILNTKRFK
jgi:predicted HicB family RNase H-like nuclease